MPFGRAIATRRTFIVGATAASLLAACGGDDASTPSADPTTAGIVGEVSAVRFFGPYYLAGEPARVPIGLADDEGLLARDATPASIGIEVRDADGTVVAGGLSSQRYDTGLPRPYFAFTFTPETAGFYDVVVATGIDGMDDVVTQVQIVEADDPAASAIVGPGDAMPALVTPTTETAAGVDPICTRTPQCPLHAVTVADAIEAAAPFLLLVSTPAFCQTVICGPVLDVLLDVLDEHPDLTVVHAEVYHHPEENESPPVPDDFAPVIDDLGLAFEPVLYTVGGDGIVRERLDYIFGAEEMRAVIGELLA